MVMHERAYRSVIIMTEEARGNARDSIYHIVVVPLFRAICEYLFLIITIVNYIGPPAYKVGIKLTFEAR